MYHPWRALRELSDWTLRWQPLVGCLGLTTWHDQTITLDPDQDQAQRRSTLAHELEHIVRGYAQCGDREECLVELRAARKLIGIHELGEALAWAHNLAEAAEELWVDEQMLRTRLGHLHPAERHYLRRRLERPDATPTEEHP